MKTIYLAVALLLNCAVLTAQSYILDPTFGTGGIVINNVLDPGVSQDYLTSAALQPDGKILATGWSSFSIYTRLSLVRYQSDGNLDAGFGINGVITADFGATESRGNALALQSDGKILVAGTALINFETHFALARFQSDGSPDSTFGIAGKVVTDLGSTFETADMIAVQPDGKIITAGIMFSSSIDFAMVRYNPTGSLDTTFGSGGIVITPIREEDEAKAIAIQPDGKILLAGYTAQSGSVDYVVVRYNPQGMLDNSFGTGGIAITDLSNTDLGTCMLLLPDGKILVGGNANFQNVVGGDVGLVRYNTNGSLDASFGTNGISILNDGSISSVWDMARQPDGKVFVAGQSRVVKNTTTWVFLRTFPDGSLDGNFGNSGSIFTDLPGNKEYPTAVLIQPDSKVLLAGRVSDNGNPDFAVARYIADFNLSATVVQGTSCSGAIITVAVSGGIPPYNYSLNGIDFQSDSTFTGVVPGIYTITIKDSNGDGITGSLTSIVVPEPPANPVVTLDVIKDSLTVQVTDTTGAFQYSIDGGATFQTGNIFSNLANGTYPVVVLDENGCTIFTDTLLIDFTGLKQVLPEITFDVSPNPGDGLFKLKIAASSSAALELTVTDMFGSTVYTSRLPADRTIDQPLDLRFLGTGIFQLRLRNGEKWRTKKVVIVR